MLRNHARSIVLLVVLLLAGTIPAAAATLIVTNTDDSGPGSLRQAIADAASGDTITFALPLPATILLNLADGESSLLVIDKDLTITGPGAAQLSVSRSPFADPGPFNGIFHVAPGVTATIQNLTLAGGAFVGSLSGGVWNQGTLTISGCTLSHLTGRSAGAIYHTGPMLTISNSVFSDNALSYDAGAGGGAIYNLLSAPVTVINSSFTNNRGKSAGAIYSEAALSITGGTFAGNASAQDGGAITITDYSGVHPVVLITNSTFSGNTSNDGDGGAIHGDDGAKLTVSSSTFSGNTAITGGGVSASDLEVRNSTFSNNFSYGGAISISYGTLVVSDSTLSNNTGGGIVFNSVTQATISGSTLSGNTGDYGGGIYTQGPMTITNSTLSGNTVVFEGGGIWNASPSCDFDPSYPGCGGLTLNNVTLWANSVDSGGQGGGLFNSGAVNIKHTIIGSNVGGDCFNASAAAGQVVLNSAGTNFATDDSCPTFIQATAAELNLDPLADNGGPTYTHALLPGSLAIDTATDGTDWDGNPVTTDQRGFDRPQGAASDAGAFEAKPSRVLQSIAVTPATATVFVGKTQQFTATGTYSDGTTAPLTSTAAWQSSNTSVATVDSAGVATGVAAGTVTITATQEGKSGSATLTVSAPVLQAITVTPATASVANGQTQQFTAIGTFSDGSTANLTSTAMWKSSNTKVATVKNGLATGVAAGTVTITATQSGKSGTATLTVTTVNNPPVAVNDTASTKANMAVMIRVLANDSDPDGDKLTVTGIPAPPAHGTAAININNNTITYTSSSGFKGTDTFQYQISDGHGGTAAATVTVTVK
jgi:hypothetical protein